MVTVLSWPSGLIAAAASLISYLVRLPEAEELLPEEPEELPPEQLPDVQGGTGEGTAITSVAAKLKQNNRANKVTNFFILFFSIYR